MHLLAAQPGVIDDGAQAVDLGQKPGDIVILSAADSDLALLARARRALARESEKSAGEFPSVRLANLMALAHNMSVDLYVESVVAHARLVVVRLLGGRGYWSYGVDEISRVCAAKGIPVAFLPGDDQPDGELADLSTVAAAHGHRLWRYLSEGGADNARDFLILAAELSGAGDYDGRWCEPRPLMKAGLYWPLDEDGATPDGIARLRREYWKEGLGVAVVVFYRALVQSANLKPIDGLIWALLDAGLNPLPIFVSSLKDPVSLGILRELMARAHDDVDFPMGVVVNTTGFAAAAPGGAAVELPFDTYGLPVLQAVLSGGAFAGWRDGDRGLGPRDIAMNVALPEVDGRIITRAVSFKGRAERDEASQCDIVAYQPACDRIDFVAALAANWAWLRGAPNWSKNVALVLANYPNRDGRLGNGVGLDAPQGAIEILRALDGAGYEVEDIPEDGNALIALLKEGPTNDHTKGKQGVAPETYALADYREFFATLPEGVRRKTIKQWGPPEGDPFMRCDGRFAIPARRFGNVVVAVQPARGYNIDPVKTYHDADLVPPHGYLAFYAWLRREFAADAVVHVGKHGNLEWLPGKAVALGENCFPEAALGPLPHLYPFIVNDPGEGTQAKRRAGAVIIDHLTPPLTRAESYGPLRDLEALVDEYYEAAGGDPRRTRVLRRDILELCHASGLDRDIGIEDDGDEETQLMALDGYLCELKEMQIRDGLHIFGVSPHGGQLTDLLTALVRLPRGKLPEEQSLHRALAHDLGLDGFDPLDCAMAAPWAGPRPAALAALDERSWRSHGDTVERIEMLASALIGGARPPDPAWRAARTVLGEIEGTLRPNVQKCGEAEIAALLDGLGGRFVAPGPSGAPTRGRPDVLPTGRNFYSLDTRTVPTPAAWTLGWKSASLLVERHLQDTGDWPRTLGLSCWGTSNMRTGGDDIAQALALMGVKPTWDGASRRVTGFEVLPASVLGRPRVDVTIRVSGFFRDAFPGLIDLLDSAARAVAALDEGGDENPLAEKVRADGAAMIARGVDEKEAMRLAGFRVFGSKPGAYGAGLQALMDEQGWEDDADLARAYVAWGSYAYGGGADGEACPGVFETRLNAIEAVVHNQDNREHDVLDSDDYYQFEGGMAAAVRVHSGRQPVIWHNDHSRPESPKIRTLDDEIGRVVRARVVNPKWIAGVMRHGYKGAFEMAATVDYMVSFAATARCVKDHHFDAVFTAYLDDAGVCAFLRDNNPDALREMASRLLEAQRRGLWTPRLNATYEVLSRLAGEEKA
ncbi:cobaltochelatase subunit CobN [Varunaivibrio sulfuroxidans]|uniref:Cobaltochelatase subunit CobN n=1 Tax=Varunaivibrio sulfuroxidans TaxID=1773489 RepID=A0A4R3JGS5_9PROT|nr:cobaltochelatase subunit CobN [Varunaivibrio sulfuroxidans]TCS65144.1 cobaltochelatase CobN subunit [Varunaivibrio sulfuroxidans]WES29571.1 cobaltochelatase subunit CobN [Varunaivibrio sulfuroxidans]